MTKKKLFFDLSAVLFFVVCPVSVVLATAFAMSLQPVIDAGLSGDIQRFKVQAGWALLLCGADVSFGYLSDWLEFRSTTAFTKRLRLRSFDRLLQSKASKFHKKDSSYYMNKLTEDSEVITEKYFESIFRIYKSVWSLFVSVAAIVAARWELSVFVILFSFVSVNLPKLFQKKALAAEEEYLESNDRYISRVQESIHNYTVWKIFGAAGLIRDKYEESVSELERRDRRRKEKETIVQNLAAAVSEISFVLIVIAAIWLVIEGKITVGYVTAISQLIGGIMFPFETLPTDILSYRTGKRIYENNLEELAALIAAPGRKEAGEASDYITAEHVSFSYDAAEQEETESAEESGGASVRKNLSDICLKLERKKKYALVGASGSGKSTLAKMLIGFLEPESGSVRMEGVSLSELDETAIYQNTAYQGQAVTLLNDTISNNILLGRKYRKRSGSASCKPLLWKSF